MKYECKKDFIPGRYFTKNKIYNIGETLIIRPSEDEDPYYIIDSYDDVNQPKVINKLWWDKFNKECFERCLPNLNSNINIL